MNEVLTNEKLARPAARPRELGVVACAGCPFAQLGCPKEGTGDCPPPEVKEVIKAKEAIVLLENDEVNTVIATDGGYEGLLEKPKERLSNILSMPSIAAPLPDKPVSKIEKPKQVVAPKPPKRREQSLGELAALVLLPARKPS